MSARPIDLLRRTTCPHCWHSFAPEDVLWISGHADLRGDPRLGPDHPLRFLPTRFTTDGAALDARGFACTSLACPRCHLGIPRALLESEPFFVSIIGTPSCGKSYYLAALTWQLRSVMPADFGLSFVDADPSANLTLAAYERALFLNSDPDAVVPLVQLIRKTELQGDLYDTVSFGNQTVSYPRPFMFAVRPLPRHPNHIAADRTARVLCVYDNAGEHCLPGQDSTATPVTHHLAKARVLLFLFDPTQDPRFRRKFIPDKNAASVRVTNRQELVLAEIANRIRRLVGLGQSAQYDRPLIVVVTKSDVWAQSVGHDIQTEAWKRHGEIAGLDLERINSTSRAVRAMLESTCPEIVTTAEQFASRVHYVPVSALGRPPSVDPITNSLVLRPRDIRPRWVAIPLLISLRDGVRGLVSRLKSYSNRDSVMVERTRSDQLETSRRSQL